MVVGVTVPEVVTVVTVVFRSAVATAANPPRPWADE
jgi:hypothetical protein